MKKYINIKIGLLFACFLLLASCAEEFKAVEPPTGSTIVDVASNSADFNILTAALKKTGLASSLANNNSGSFTVFAPTDDAFIAYFKSITAFAAFGEPEILNWINTTLAPTSTSLNLPTLTSILLYHVVSSEIPSSQVKGAQGFVTLSGAGARLSLSKSGSTIIFNANKAGYAAGNGSQSVTMDIDASNGVIHSINKVLIPVTTNNIWIGTNAVVAPATSIVNLPNFIVSYATSPPTITVFGATMLRNPSPDGSINISNVPTGTLNDYNLISAAIVRAELAPVIFTITTPFPDFTLFAPTDAAFIAYLGVANEAAAITAINALSPTALADVVKYHIVAGRVVTTDLADGQAVTTLLSGKTFTVGISGSTVTLKDNNTAVDPTFSLTGANTNFLTNAGVVHQINAVLRSN
ncbi:MAG: fasciclin domain-containing protein [Cyclobacteriaceae bacterium]